MSYLPKYHVQHDEVHSLLKKHILAEGYNMSIDLQKSKGSRIYDQKSENLHWNVQWRC